MANIHGRGTRLRAARRRRRDRHELRALRLRPGRQARMDHGRCRRDLSGRRRCPASTSCCPTSASSRSSVDNLRGIVITHAHEDHYGALLDLWPSLKAPVWMTPFAAGLLEAKRQGEANAPKIPVTIYRAGETFKVGPFKIEAIPVTHSIPEPVSLAITTPLGTVIHTGDWKIDPAPEIGPMTDEARFRALGDDGVLALICDSTNAMREGESPSEQAVGDGLRERHREGAGPRRRHHLLLQCRAHPLDRRGRARCRPPGAGARPLAEAHDQRRRRTRLHGGHAGIHRRGGLRLHPAREPRRHLHRQPGRAARRAGQAGARRDEDGGAVAGRHRGLLLAHHSRQREGDPRDQEPADRPGHQDHRGRRRAGPCLRPSAPQRAAQDVRMDAAAASACRCMARRRIWSRRAR